MAIEIKVASFRRQVLLAIVIFFVCAIAIVVVKRSRHRVETNNFPLPNERSCCDYGMQREIIVERDVEVNMLEPLLFKLGFNRQDWVRQLPVRIGRGERTFPDYAILVRGKEDDLRAEYIWEAKYSIPSECQLHIDFRQARSYALLLRAKALCLVAKEGVWFVSSDLGFEFESIKHFTWKELTDDKNLRQLSSYFQTAKSKH